MKPVSPAVQRALDATFGELPVSMEPLGGGHSSARLYRVTAGGRAYVLRLVGERTPFNDPARQFACLAIAAGRQLAPALRYASVADGVVVMDHVATGPAPPSAGRHHELATLLRRLHDGPAFPVFMSILDVIPAAARMLEGMGRLEPPVRAYLSRIDGVRAALRPLLVSAPCHNDLNPNNLLWDGQRRWLIDWESSCMGDPFFDLATVATFFRIDGDAEADFLAAYLQRAPTPADRAKLHLMRQLALCFYALMFMLGAGGAEVASPEPLASLGEALAAIGAGAFDLAQPEHRLRLARLLIQESLTQLASAGSSR